jgi:tetratricopeptide (TPR) repeat protein
MEENLSRKEKLQHDLTNFERALEVYPKSATLWNNKSIALFMIGKREEALTSIDQALKLRRNSIPILCNKAKILLDLGKNDEYCRIYNYVYLKYGIHEESSNLLNFNYLDYESFLEDIKGLPQGENITPYVTDWGLLGEGLFVERENRNNLCEYDEDSFHDKIEYGDYVCENFDD